MKKIMLIMLLALSLSACTDEEDARNALENQGFTDIVFNGTDLWACSNSDNYATKFTATNSLGKRVSGVVCTGMGKGSTIRW